MTINKKATVKVVFLCIYFICILSVNYRMYLGM